MNYYCDNCHLLNEQEHCQRCGKKNLRSPNNSDFCFLIEVDSMFGEMFKGILDEEKIPYADFPSGNGVRSTFALRLENLKIFVVYEFFYKAKELLNDIYRSVEEAEEEQLRDFKKNLDKLFALPRNEKKIKKKLKIPENSSLKSYCADIIMNADRIINKGRIGESLKFGEYLYVYKDTVLIVINSATYEIIATEKTSKRDWG